ncbi:hypothetical protein DVH24_025412 [Malus domestica]|uniref:Uncharacterized protein n=1 Tax=Malus domestica TaxID=3750 RepID=A0A498HRY1_MALDO|nr:hypothetical protein DVH24_025412 [Malus domestica]
MFYNALTSLWITASVKKHSQVERRKPTIARSEQQLQRFTDPTWNRHLSHVLDPHKAYKRENWMISSSETGNPENQCADDALRKNAHSFF